VFFSGICFLLTFFGWQRGGVCKESGGSQSETGICVVRFGIELTFPFFGGTFFEWQHSGVCKESGG